MSTKAVFPNLLSAFFLLLSLISYNQNRIKNLLDLLFFPWLKFYFSMIDSLFRTCRTRRSICSIVGTRNKRTPLFRLLTVNASRFFHAMEISLQFISLDRLGIYSRRNSHYASIRVSGPTSNQKEWLRHLRQKKSRTIAAAMPCQFQRAFSWLWEKTFWYG